MTGDAVWGGGAPLPARGTTEFFVYLKMAYFDIFSGTKFNFFVTTKSCKNHKMHGEQERMGQRVTDICCHFILTWPMSTKQLNHSFIQLNPVSPSIVCLRYHEPLGIQFCNILSQKQTQFFSVSLHNKLEMTTIAHIYCIMYILFRCQC